jgi:hypothetical protein
MTTYVIVKLDYCATTLSEHKLVLLLNQLFKQLLVDACMRVLVYLLTFN